jgi:hypothetical protein
MYAARIIADSRSPSGARITTMEVSYPAAVHWDHLRHRSFSFSVASNRAIPTKAYIARVIQDPAHPEQWGANQAGMVAREELKGWRKSLVRRLWLAARWPAVILAWLCWKLGAHKEIVNWLLFPWAWVTLIVTGTDWSNFFALRCHPHARPEMRRIAVMMRDEYERSEPAQLSVGQWHLPYVTPEERRFAWNEHRILCKLSTARCARVSLLKHGEVRPMRDETRKADELCSNGHMSPFEHAARALADGEQRVANYRGWASFRSTIPNEHDFSLLTEGKAAS